MLCIQQPRTGTVFSQTHCQTLERGFLKWDTTERILGTMCKICWNKSTLKPFYLISEVTRCCCNSQFLIRSIVGFQSQFHHTPLFILSLNICFSHSFTTHPYSYYSLTLTSLSMVYLQKLDMIFNTEKDVLKSYICCTCMCIYEE